MLINTHSRFIRYTYWGLKSRTHLANDASRKKPGKKAAKDDDMIRCLVSGWPHTAALPFTHTPTHAGKQQLRFHSHYPSHHRGQTSRFASKLILKEAATQTVIIPCLPPLQQTPEAIYFTSEWNLEILLSSQSLFQVQSSDWSANNPRRPLNYECGYVWKEWETKSIVLDLVVQVDFPYLRPVSQVL